MDGRGRNPSLLQRFLGLGTDPLDDEETRLRKVLVLSAVLIIAPLALLWGSLYWFFGAHLAAAIPWLYVAIAVLSVAVFSANRSFRWLAICHLTPYVVLPFVLMWILGGFLEGSAAGLWALFAPLAALFVSGPRAAAPWLAAFLALLLASALVTPRPLNALPPEVVAVFFVLNIGGVTVVAFALLGAFKGRREAMLGAARGLVRRYLSPDVAASLLADPRRLELGGEVIEVSVLFADLRGFTSFAESLEPGEAVRRLNQYFGVAVPAIVSEGGTPIGFAGDEVMALFNAPRPQPDHALHAARAALQIQRRVEGLVDGPTTPRFGIGINSGPALVGNVGSEDLRNFTAIGDTTNLAARLQELAAPGAVVIGPATASLLAGTGRLSRLGSLTIRGRHDPVEVFRLDGLPGDADGSGPLTR